jgi:hypothetical protein
MSEVFSPQQKGAQTAWAKRRLNDGVRLLTEWLGARPARIVLWQRDYDRLMESKRVELPDDIEFVRGPPKPERK